MNCQIQLDFQGGRGYLIVIVTLCLMLLLLIMSRLVTNHMWVFLLPTPSKSNLMVLKCLS